MDEKITGFGLHKTCQLEVDRVTLQPDKYDELMVRFAREILWLQQGLASANNEIHQCQGQIQKLLETECEDLYKESPMPN